MRTRDGGASWRGIPAPKASLDVGSDQASAIDQLRFADPLNGYADGVGLWVTHDGGAHWAWQQTVAGIRNAVVTDVVASGHTVYAVASGTDTKYGGTDSHFRLISATAASGRFRVVADLGLKRQAFGLVAAGGAVYLLNIAVGAVGTGPIPLIRVVGTSLTGIAAPASDCTEVAASTASALVLVCGQGVASGSSGAREVWGSSNSGLSFQRLPGPGRGGGYDGSGVADAGNGHAVIGTVSGELGELRSTGDGARTWHTSLRIDRAVFADLGFEDGQHGVVIVTVSNGKSTDGRLYRTSNAGASWARVTFGR